MRIATLVVGVGDLQELLGLLPSTIKVVGSGTTHSGTNTVALRLEGDFPPDWEHLQFICYATSWGRSFQLSKRVGPAPSLFE
jgi:hypothetical protein